MKELKTIRFIICGIIGAIGGRAIAVEDWFITACSITLLVLFLAYWCLSDVYYGEVNPHTWRKEKEDGR